MQRDTAFNGLALSASLVLTVLPIVLHISILLGRVLFWGGACSSLLFIWMLSKQARQSAGDTPIWKAVAHVASKVGDTNQGDYFRRARAQIEGKALAGELFVWGRKQLDSDPEWVETRKFSDRCMPIPPDYWAISKLAPYAGVEPMMSGNVVDNVPCTNEADKGTWPKKRNAYADLRVNWQQVKKLWP